MVSMVSMVAMVTSVSLSAGGCAPRAKPFAYVGGAVLSVAGTAMMADASSTDCTPEDPFTGVLTVPLCASASAFGVMVGALTLLTGAGLLVAAIASPSASDAAEPPAAFPPAPGLPGAAPAMPAMPPSWSPSWSPSAPSGSPLAQPPSASLSMRAGSQSAFR